MSDQPTFDTITPAEFTGLQLKAMRMEAAVEEYAKLRVQLEDTERERSEAAKLSHEYRNLAERAEAERDEARQWARHGYEIGQRHCSWSDHGVAPAWLTEGWPPHIDSCEHLKQMAQFDEALSRVRALADGWVKAGPPPLGASMARWWDARLVELNAALDEPKEPCGAGSNAPNALGNERCTLPTGHDGRHAEGITTWPRDTARR